MAREGTRSATGNSKPRVFQTIDTAPAIARKPRAKTTTTTPATKKAGAKPTGVTKKTAPKKESTIAKKAKAAVKKVEAKVKKTTTTTKAKPKTAAK